MDVFVELKATISDYLTKMRTVRSDMDDTSKSADNLGARTQAAGEGMGFLTKTALTVGPALAPIGTVLTGLAVGLGGIGVAAGAGLGAFALAAKPVITNITAASAAQQKYSQAVATYGPASSQAKTAQLQMNAAVGGLSPAAKNAAEQLTNAKSAYQSWAQSLAPQVIPVFTEALSMLKPLLADITPLVVSVSGALQEVGGQFQILLSQSQPFFKVLSTVAGTVIRDLGDSFAQLAGGLMNAFTAAAPLIKTVADLLFQVSVAFGSLNFQAVLGPLIANFQTLAPIVGKFAQSLFVIIGGILKAIAPIGVALFGVISAAVTAILPVVQTLGQVIGAIAPVIGAVAESFAGVLGTAIAGLAPIIQSLLPLVTQIVKLLGGGLIDIFKAVQPAIAAALPVVGALVSALVSALGPAIKNLGPLISDLEPLTFVFVPVAHAIATLSPLFGELARVISQLLGPVGTIIGSFLSAGGAVLGQLVPALVSLAGTLISDLLPVIKDLVPILPQIADLMGVALAGAVQILLPLIQGLVPILNVLIPVLAAVLIPTLNFLVTVLKMVPGPILAIGAALLLFDVNPVVIGVGLIVLAIGELVTHWSAVWGEIKHLFDDAVGFLRSGFGTVALLILGPIGALIDLALHWQQIWGGIKAVTADIWHAIDAVIRTVWTALRDWLKAEWNAFTGTARTLWTGVTGAITVVWHGFDIGVRAVWTNLKAFFSNEWAGWKTIVKGIWDGIVGTITGSWSALTTGASTLWTNVKAGFVSGINDVISAINTIFIGPIDGALGIVDLKIPNIPLVHAATGAKVGPGGITNGPAVLVGEGRRAWPEYVIPTDPQHRRNATKLTSMLLGDIGMRGLAGGGTVGSNPNLGAGKGGGQGIKFSGGLDVSSIGGLVGDVASAIRSGVASAIMASINAIAHPLESLLGGIPPAALGTSAEGAVKRAVTDIGSYIAGHPYKTPGGGGPVNTSFVANQALGQQMAAAMGWTGAEWSALNAVEMDEAGWNPTAQNKTSSAYGIAQFINGAGEYAQYGGNSNTVAGQITGMLNYIRGRYGDPIGALAHENAFHWYDQGGVLPPGLTMAMNATGRDEYVSRTPPGGAPSITVIVEGNVLNWDQTAAALVNPLRRALNQGTNRNSQVLT